MRKQCLEKMMEYYLFFNNSEMKITNKMFNLTSEISDINPILNDSKTRSKGFS
jgi:hypothetical protein